MISMIRNVWCNQPVPTVIGVDKTYNLCKAFLTILSFTILGVTSGKRKGDRKTWWCNGEVQESIKEKKEAKKAWDKIRNKNTKRYTNKRKVR